MDKNYPNRRSIRLRDYDYSQSGLYYVGVSDSGSILDTSTLDIGENTATEKEKRFIFFYTYPGTDAFQVQAKAAARAGYKDAHRTGYSLRKKENVAAAIKYIMDTKVKIDLEEEYHKILEMKKRRIHYDIGEYVKKTTKIIRVGKGDDAQEYEEIVEVFKEMDELTPEQREVIDGMDYKGQQANVKVLNFADRDKAMADILTIHNKINGGTDADGFDVELTAEIIKGNLAVKIGTRKKKQDMINNADFMEVADKKIEEL